MAPSFQDFVFSVPHSDAVGCPALAFCARAGIDAAWANLRLFNLLLARATSVLVDDEQTPTAQLSADRVPA